MILSKTFIAPNVKNSSFNGIWRNNLITWVNWLSGTNGLSKISWTKDSNLIVGLSKILTVASKQSKLDKFVTTSNRPGHSEGSKLDDISQKLAKRSERKESEPPKDAKKRKDSTSTEESVRPMRSTRIKRQAEKEDKVEKEDKLEPREKIKRKTEEKAKKRDDGKSKVRLFPLKTKRQKCCKNQNFQTSFSFFRWNAFSSTIFNLNTWIGLEGHCSRGTKSRFRSEIAQEGQSSRGVFF